MSSFLTTYRVTLGQELSGEDLTRDVLNITDKGSSTRITTATTTVCRTGSGNLRRVLVEVALVNTVTFYNNTAASGTILTILPAALPVGVYELGAEFTVGCTAVTAGADRLVVITGV